MRRFPLLLTFLLCVVAILPAESRWAFQGTVIKMQTSDCMPGHNFMAAMSGAPGQKESCPEYTVMGKQVVYEVVGRSGNEFMPLAEDIDFAIRKNEIVIFGHDEKVQARFIIKRMTLRGDWEREQEREALELREKERIVRSAGFESLNPAHASLLAIVPR